MRADSLFLRPGLVALALLASMSSVAPAQREIPLSETVHTDRPFELQLIAALRDFVPHVIRAKGTPGLNVALGRDGRLIWEAGFGFADVAAETPMKPDTVYHSGSLGKTYTATAVMHLVDRGVISLDDPIKEHLPFEVHNPLGDRDITVRDLMTHRSGLSTGGAKGGWDKPESLAAALQASYASEKSPLVGGWGLRGKSRDPRRSAPCHARARGPLAELCQPALSGGVSPAQRVGRGPVSPSAAGRREVS